MLWALGSEYHPFRVILCSHLRKLSQRKWGYPDFTWVTTKGGSNKSNGSPVWCNICLAWHKLKPSLAASTPRNLEEWRNLPLWRPDQLHRSAALVRCTTRAQQQLRQRGPLTLAYITSNSGEILPWHDVPRLRTGPTTHRHYATLTANLLETPTFMDSTKPQ